MEGLNIENILVFASKQDLGLTSPYIIMQPPGFSYIPDIFSGSVDV